MTHVSNPAGASGTSDAETTMPLAVSLDLPVLFSGELIPPILAGRKTQTRRVLAKWGDPGRACLSHVAHPSHGKAVATFHDRIPDDPAPLRVACRYGGIGCTLWVREAFHLDVEHDGRSPSAAYELARSSGRPLVYETSADGELHDECGRRSLLKGGPRFTAGKLRPGIHMPRWASRIGLRVTDIHAQRVQDITGRDAWAEGIEASTLDARPELLDRLRRERFADLWDKINGPRGQGWDVNPWVWRVSFEVIR